MMKKVTIKRADYKKAILNLTDRELDYNLNKFIEAYNQNCQELDYMDGYPAGWMEVAYTLHLLEEEKKRRDSVARDGYILLKEAK